MVFSFMYLFFFIFFFKQKTAYEMRISDWSSDVCSSDLRISLNFETKLMCRNFVNRSFSSRMKIRMPPTTNTTFVIDMFPSFDVSNDLKVSPVYAPIDRKSVV